MGLPRVDQRGAVREPPDEGDVGVTGDRDVNVLSEVPLEQGGDLIFGAVLGVLEVVGESDRHPLDLDDDDVGDPGLPGTPGGRRCGSSPLPRTDQRGGDPVEAVDDIDDVEISAVEDAVAPRQHGVGLRGKIGAR